MNLHRRLLLLLVAALMVAVTAVATVGPAFGKVGQDSKVSGTARELAGEWWRWVLSKPVAESPLIGSDSSDPPYSEEQCNGQPVNPVTDTSNEYWFLGGTFDGSKVERTCTAPSDKQLYFPVANLAYINTEPSDTEEVARQFVNDAIDSIEADPRLSMSVKVDGKEVKDNQIVRADSPLFTATVPEDGLLPAGSYTGVADGLWATLPPLSAGEHTIQFKMSSPKANMDPTTPRPEGFSQDNTYHLTVE